jgi:hypothetical protein
MKTACYVVAFVGLAITLIATPYPAFAQMLPTYAACAGSSNPELCGYAMRFRPYMRFEYDGSDEPNAPCTWKWFIKDSDFELGQGCPTCSVVDLHYLGDKAGYLTPDDVMNYANADIRYYNNALGSQNPGILLVPNDQGGEPWVDPSGQGQDVVSGDGFYAHVEQINEDLISIEYWTLFPYNQGLNSTGCQIIDFLQNLFSGDIGDIGNHNGDLIVVSLVYCKSCGESGQIIRATFVQHGTLILDYDLNQFPIANVDYETFTDMNVQTYSARHLTNLTNYYENEHYLGVSQSDASTCWGGCAVYCFSGLDPIGCAACTQGCSLLQTIASIKDLHTPASSADGGAQVYFVQDPDTQLYDHIAVYPEWGSHEPWPSKNGSTLCMPSHGGTGKSFLPKQVTYLGTTSDMMDSGYDNAPFIFYNGKWGSDPQPPILHREWLYPAIGTYNCSLLAPYTCRGYFGVPPSPPLFEVADVKPSRFVDPDPYTNWTCTNGTGNDGDDCVGTSVAWPPAAVPASRLLPPVTQVFFTGPTYTNGNTTYISGKTSISFEVTPNPLTASYGPDYTYYRAYPAEPMFVSYSGPFTLGLPDGPYRIDYYSKDSDYDQELGKSTPQFTLDTTPPVITITQPTAVRYPHWATLTLNYSANDGTGSGVASVTATIDGMSTVGGQVLASGKAINLENLSLGTHVFTVTATDHVGNTSTSSVTFSLITTPVDCSVVAPEVLVNGQKEFTITATVTPDPPASVFPTGKVQIWDAAFNVHVIPDPTLINGVASMTVELAPTPTTQWIMFIYPGDTNFKGCQSQFAPARWVF